MAATFQHNGMRFQYPENWRLEQDESEDGWTVTVQSLQTAFMVLTVNEELPATEEMLATALETLKTDYPELEAEDVVDTVAGQPAIGHDIQFISLDLTNTCWTRSFYSAAGTVLVLCQYNDLDNEIHEQVLRAMCASLEVDD
jgi:hypothetical protein